MKNGHRWFGPKDDDDYDDDDDDNIDWKSLLMLQWQLRFGTDKIYFSFCLKIYSTEKIAHTHAPAQMLLPMMMKNAMASTQMDGVIARLAISVSKVLQTCVCVCGDVIWIFGNVHTHTLCLAFTFASFDILYVLHISSSFHRCNRQWMIWLRNVSQNRWRWPTFGFFGTKIKRMKRE